MGEEHLSNPFYRCLFEEEIYKEIFCNCMHPFDMMQEVRRIKDKQGLIDG